VRVAQDLLFRQDLTRSNRTQRPTRRSFSTRARPLSSSSEPHAEPLWLRQSRITIPLPAAVTACCRARDSPPATWI